MEGQISIFSLFGEETAAAQDEPILPNVSEFPLEERLMKEKEMIGLYVSGHPLENYKKAIEQRANTDSTSFMKTLGEDVASGRVLKDKETVVMAGLVVSRKQKTTKTGKAMCILQLEDFFGDYEVLVFPSAFAKCGSVVLSARALLMRGQVQVEDEEVKLFLEDAVALSRDDEELCSLPEPARNYGGSYAPRRSSLAEQTASMKKAPSDNGARSVAESVPAQAAPVAVPAGTKRVAIRYYGTMEDAGYKRLLATCAYFRGNVPVYVSLPNEGRDVILPVEYSIEWSRDVVEILVKEFGIENVSQF